MSGTAVNAEWYLGLFEEFERSLNGESKSALHTMRKGAISQFARLGFPTVRDEEWRFTNIAPMVRIPFSPVLKNERNVSETHDISEFILSDFPCFRVVFVDGHFREDLSVLPGVDEGIRIENLASAAASDPSLLEKLNTTASPENEPFTALNTAFLQDGILISVPDGKSLETPVHLLYVAGQSPHPFLVSPRNLILVGKGSTLSLIETYAGPGENIYLTNAVSEIVLDEDAVIEHDRLQQESEKAYYVGSTHVRQKRGSRYRSNSIMLGGSIARNNIVALLDDRHCECVLNGLTLGTGRQVLDNHTTIDHASPECESHELYKSILDGRSKGVFNGKIFVRQDAQKTDAKQTNKTLLLSDDATIDTKPQLEIFADDVKCTHGATVGRLDEEQLFYLRSRGIILDEARDILTFAFAGDIVERVHCEPLRNRLEELLHSRLRHGRVRGHGDESDD